MSKVVDLCQESNDGEWPNTASCPSLQFLGKRPRGREELSYNAYPRNENGPGNKTTIGLASFVFDLEVADEVVVSQYRKRRGAIIGKPSGKNAAVGKCVQILKGVSQRYRKRRGCPSSGSSRVPRRCYFSSCITPDEFRLRTGKRMCLRISVPRNKRHRNHRRTQLGSEGGSPGKTV
jgi:hypothetical protein